MILEDIFDAEDSLPADVELDDLPQDFFSALSTDCTKPLLSPMIIRKLLKYVGQVTRPTKRMRQGGVGGFAGTLSTPRSKVGRMTDVDVPTLSRLLKILERTVKASEDIDPFQSPLS